MWEIKITFFRTTKLALKSDYNYCAWKRIRAVIILCHENYLLYFRKKKPKKRDKENFKHRSQFSQLYVDDDDPDPYSFNWNIVGEYS